MRSISRLEKGNCLMCDREYCMKVCILNIRLNISIVKKWYNYYEELEG